MHLRYQIAFIITITLLLTVIVGFYSHRQEKQFIADKIEEFQQNQLNFVRQVEDKIRRKFASLNKDLYLLSQDPTVQFLKKNRCLLRMIRTYNVNQPLVTAIYRTDAAGHLCCSYPSQSCPINNQELAGIQKQCHQTGESIFHVIRRRHDGNDYLMIACPVYSVLGKKHFNPSNKFAGLLFFTVTLKNLQQHLFADAVFGHSGYPWIIDEKTLLVCTSNKTHIGKKFTEFLDDELSPAEQQSILKVLTRMRKGEEGTGSYFYRLHKNQAGAVNKLVAFTPLHLPHQTWSIAVVNPQKEIITSLSLAIKKQRFYHLSIILIIAVLAAMVILLLNRNHRQEIERLTQLEKETRLAKNEWQETFDALEDIILLLDKDLRVIRGNKAAAKICGCSRDKLAGQPYFQIFMKSSDTPANDPVLLCQQNGKSQTMKIHSQITNKTMMVSASPIKNDNHDNIPKYIVYAKDISAMEKMQQKLQQSQKMEAIGLVAGGAAHDLNNILSGIVSYPELLLLDLPKESPLQRPLQTIKNAGERAAAIVQDLLAITRRGVQKAEILNLNTIINAYLQSPENENIRKRHPRIQLETKLEGDLWPINGSPMHLSKMVMNLISNAIESIKDQGSVVVTTANHLLNHLPAGVKQSGSNKYISLSISDTGAGISPEDQEKIFEPFYSKKQLGHSGTGLGMTVVWGTVQDHHGFIEIDSTVGRGTTIAVYLPATDRLIEKNIEDQDSENYQGQGETILVVDDLEQQRQIAKTMLERLGYRPITMASGEEAVAYLEEQSVDLVLLDMIMDPGIDGLETYKRIIRLHPYQKTIVVSGYAETENIQQVMDLGVSGYLKKPYLLKEFGLAVRKALDSSG